MNDINYWAVLLAAVGQFALGGLWYTVIFGNLWGKMHNFDKLSKAKQQEMASKMGPWYGLQFLVSIFTAFVLAKLMILLPNYSPYTLAALLWFGLVLPTEYSAVVFGGTEGKWIVKKIAVSSLGILACLFLSVFILRLF